MLDSQALLTAFFNSDSFVHGNDLISQDRNGEQSFYHVDGLGSTRALSDESGLATDSYIYDAFGQVLTKIGDTDNSYLFAGEQRDSNLGLDYLRARYLDVATGRFVSRDTFAGSLQEPITQHRFLYANANPVINIDPSGFRANSLAELSAALSFVGLGFGLFGELAGGYFGKDAKTTLVWRGVLFTGSIPTNIKKYVGQGINLTTFPTKGAPGFFSKSFAPTLGGIFFLGEVVKVIDRENGRESYPTKNQQYGAVAVAGLAGIGIGSLAGGSFSVTEFESPGNLLNTIFPFSGFASLANASVGLPIGPSFSLGTRVRLGFAVSKTTALDLGSKDTSGPFGVGVEALFGGVDLLGGISLGISFKGSNLGLRKK